MEDDRGSVLRLFLLGFMGAGKSTLGGALAEYLGMEFCDLDSYIEGRYMKSVSQIFSLYGEQRFREIESALLHEVGECENIIIACGGSTPLFYDNMDYMLSRGKTLYLQASVSTLFRRLKEGRYKRPLIAQKSDEELSDYICSELLRREPGYMRAEFRCPADRLESRTQLHDTVKEVVKILGIEKTSI